jgi:hypothetical protein
MARSQKHRKKRSQNHARLERQNHQAPYRPNIFETFTVTGILIIGYMLQVSPSHKIAATWVFFAAWVLLGLFFALRLTREYKQDEKLSKDDKPSSRKMANRAAIDRREPTLEFPVFDVAVTEYSFSLGGRGITYSYSAGALKTRRLIPFELNGMQPVTIYTEGNRFFADVILRGTSNGNEIEILHNTLTRQPANWDINSNARAFEAVDETGQPVFQMKYKSKSNIVINGVFSWNGKISVATDEGMMINISAPKILHEWRAKIEPFFKYPSSKYPGEINDQ